MSRCRTLRSLVFALCLFMLFTFRASTSTGAAEGWIDAYREPAGQLIKESLATKFAWNRLAELTDTFGNRLSGSESLRKAIGWAVDELKKDGFSNVRTQKVMVPAWVRGQESLELVQPVAQKLVMLGLGGSVATPHDGLEGEVFVVKSFADLEANSQKAKGRIVLYNVPYSNYGETVVYRSTGAWIAARYGAIATLLRSVGPVGLRTPHTGGMRYGEDAPEIPSASIPVEDAERFQRLQDRGVKIVVRLKMEAHVAPDSESANVIAEIPGREKPLEVVLIGGHFDSWDVGTGASDDGVGCIVTWEAARLIKKLALTPRRTIRVVLWTNEENGLRGGNAYRDSFMQEAKDHIFALESDSGVFAPMSLGFTGPDPARRTVNEIAALLTGLGLDRVGPNGGGADIGPIVQAGHVPAMSLNGDPARYFTIHHTPADTIDRIAPEEVSKAAAAIAVMTYVIADMPNRLGQ